jgi:hypothetical protein
MDYSELQQNYFSACLKYASVQSPTYLTQANIDSFVTLGIDGSNNIYMISWNIASTAPTEADLMTFTVAEVQDIPNIKQFNADIYSLKLYTGSSNYRDNLYYVVDGLMFYNTDTNKVQVRVNGAWINLN